MLGLQPRRPLTGVSPGPPGPESRKSLKRVSRGLPEGPGDSCKGPAGLQCLVPANDCSTC